MKKPMCVCGHGHGPDWCSIIGCTCRSFRDQRDKDIEQLNLQIGELKTQLDKHYLWKNESNPAPHKMMDFPDAHWDAFTAGYFWGQRSISNTLLEDANRLNRELRTALEIALPGMVHVYSGHVYGPDSSKPVEWVDGCAKCRLMKVLTPEVKQNHE